MLPQLIIKLKIFQQNLMEEKTLELFLKQAEKNSRVLFLVIDETHQDLGQRDSGKSTEAFWKLQSAMIRTKHTYAHALTEGSLPPFYVSYLI